MLLELVVQLEVLIRRLRLFANSFEHVVNSVSLYVLIQVRVYNKMGNASQRGTEVHWHLFL